MMMARGENADSFCAAPPPPPSYKCSPQWRSPPPWHPPPWRPPLVLARAVSSRRDGTAKRARRPLAGEAGTPMVLVVVVVVLVVVLVVVVLVLVVCWWWWWCW